MTITTWSQRLPVRLPDSFGSVMLARFHHVNKDGRIVSIARRPCADMRRVNLPPGFLKSRINQILK
jgi:hypothetical protein